MFIGYNGVNFNARPSLFKTMFTSYRIEFCSVSQNYTVWCEHTFIEKLYRKSLRCKYRFVMYHLEERSVSTAIRYKKCAQIFVSSVNKNPIRYTIRNATNSYKV